VTPVLDQQVDFKLKESIKGVFIMKLVLASSSPRRKDILQNAGYTFEVKEPHIDENLRIKLPPIDLVMKLSLLKANSIFANDEDEVVVGADTIVCIDGKNIGKPENADQARSLLRQLSGRLHRVYTGVAIVSKERQETFFVQAKVNFMKLDEDLINRYIETGESFDKAGGYAIQGKGCTFVDTIDGDYFGIVGLPISQLAKRLERDYGIKAF
jgi:septum formation protein